MELDDDPVTEDDTAPDTADFDCPLDRAGHCAKAGSEECEFECPFHDLGLGE
jgi:hypothetical protein